MEKQSCIICSRPVGSDGFTGSIRDISVSFCRDHAGACDSRCDGCVHANTCSVKEMF